MSALNHNVFLPSALPEGYKYDDNSDRPLIFMDGYWGVSELAGVVRINITRDIYTNENNTASIQRKVIGELIIPKENFLNIATGLKNLAELMINGNKNDKENSDS